ncbi:hypothetical protein TNCV_3815771 [Trichonephila clavipes]|nr:hypothetical protein TNCV_3815771 [Trichonephila clavipes]
MNLNVLEEDKNYIISVLQDLNIGGDQIISIPRLITFFDLPCTIYTNRFKFQDKNLPIPAISVLFDETVEREFQKFFIIATDASKNDQITSIAETLAICQALDDLVESNVNLLVLSDSLFRFFLHFKISRSNPIRVITPPLEDTLHSLRSAGRAKKALKNAASQELNISSSIITETTPKTPAERSRDYRARKRQKSEENQESNDLTRITVEVEVHQEQDNSQPSTSTLPIKRKKTSTERVREFRARKKSLTSLSENIIEDFPTSSNIINANNNK